MFESGAIREIHKQLVDISRCATMPAVVSVGCTCMADTFARHMCPVVYEQNYLFYTLKYDKE